MKMSFKLKEGSSALSENLRIKDWISFSLTFMKLFGGSVIVLRLIPTFFHSFSLSVQDLLKLSIVKQNLRSIVLRESNKGLMKDSLFGKPSLSIPNRTSFTNKGSPHI